MSDISIRSRSRSVRGFTMVEMLGAVAVLVVLFALLVPNVFKTGLDLRQAELDAKAETIYEAVQNELTKLRSSGRASAYALPDGTNVVICDGQSGLGMPSDLTPEYKEGHLVQDVRHFSDADSEDPAARVAHSLVTSGVVDASLSSHHWVVEYDPGQGIVYGVFYSEDTEIGHTYVAHWPTYDRYRVKTVRRDDGAHVGYYGGDAAASSVITDRLSPAVMVDNGETLSLRISCRAPAGVRDIEFTLRMRDSEGHVYSKLYNSFEVTHFGRMHTLDVVLDDLSSEETRFANLYDGTNIDNYDMSNIGQALTPGTPLVVEVLARSKTNRLIEAGVGSAQTNSLFADDSTASQARIACARHLQNLGEDSGVTSTVTKASQSNDVDMRTSSEFARTYSADYVGDVVEANGHGGRVPNFVPITNASLTSYDGGRHRILGLTSKHADGAGMFSSLHAGMTCKDIAFVGANVESTGGPAGALASTVGGTNVKLVGCGSYLSGDNVRNRDDSTVWVKGTSTGGLVGEVTSGSVSVSDCLAATVAKGDNVGGLVGRVRGGQVTLRGSYADSYLSGKTVAGLATGDVASVEDCYAAGFVRSTVGAYGLVSGNVVTARHSYSIVSVDDGNASYNALFGAVGTASDCLFFVGSSSGEELGGTSAIGDMSSVDMAHALGSAFTADTVGHTTAYNLRGQALTSYDYPRLSKLRHHGDWRAEFTVGGLVYFERYADGGHGFWGAGVDALRDELVVGDGYGIAYRDSDALPASLHVTVDGHTWDIGEAYVSVTVDGVGYRIRKLPVGCICADTSGGLYHDVRVWAGDESDDFDDYAVNFGFAASQLSLGKGAHMMPSTEGRETLSVRSARQLFELSRRYGQFVSEVADVVLLQEVDVDYGAYAWNDFTTFGIISEQRPIGIDPAFSSTYDGGCHLVSGVSFAVGGDSVVGMFGFNDGVVRNVVLGGNVGHGLHVRRDVALSTNHVVAMGALAGRNDGIIENCAVAGYRLETRDGTLYSYANSTLHAGGLVGENAGVIRNCSATFDEMRISALYAQVGVGGLVGANDGSGTIDSSYVVGYEHVLSARGGHVDVSGFAGTNYGRISSSYCATAIVSSGESSVSHALCAKGGVVSDSSYLDSGTYRYLDHMRSYNGNINTTDGLAASYGRLATTGGDVDSVMFDADTDADAYPFPGVVVNGSGELTHYGNWPVGVAFGDFGVFYWEHEVGGSNPGYRVTYVSAAGDAGTTLCGSHDDGGRVAEYGYGYYVSADDASRACVSVTDLDMSIASDGGPGAYETTIGSILEREMSSEIGAGYVFYPYVTRSGGAHVSLDAGEGTYGTISVRIGDVADATWDVAPFFANSMRLRGASNLTVTGEDGRVTDYSAALGSDDNGFEVRSASQLAYINWNHVTRNCDTLVYGEQGKEQVSTGIGNYRDFPYLQYATVLTLGTQDRASVEARRPSLTWVQTHDVVGEDRQFTPIAGMATSSPYSNGSYENIIYAWFGGSYDGQSYKIENFDVVSPSYTVGLFGTTVGSDIRNVIMFSDEDSVVQRATEGLSAVEVAGHVVDFDAAPGAYSLGGLVGIAYDYAAEAGSGEISNCAIAGYRVIDSSTNQHGAGTANVGGLVGFANVNLRRCSAAARMRIESTHMHGHMAWGSFYRIGGLTGSAGAPGNGNAAGSIPLHVSECYTGGSIEVSDELREELPDSFNAAGFAISTGQGGHATSLFISGIVGGSYAPNISNFSNRNSNSPDGIAYIESCYTYTDLPDVGGSVRAVSFIANQADRYGRETQIHISNCHHMQDESSIGRPRRTMPSTWPAYFFSSSTSTGVTRVPTDDEMAAILAGDEALRKKFEKLVPSDAQWIEMLNGDLTYLRTYLNSQGTSRKGIPSADEQHYSTQADFADDGVALLGGGSWGWVSALDSAGESIDGKYSFSSDSAQLGKNYPFPTVLTQHDFESSGNAVTVNVHYGAWPTGDVWWARGRDSMDVFRDMASDGVSRKSFVLHSARGPEVVPDVSVDGDAAVFSNVSWDASAGTWRVTIEALRTGFVSVVADVDGTSASFVLEVTAGAEIVVNPERPSLFVNEPGSVTLSIATSGATWSGGGTFTLSCADAAYEDAFGIAGEGDSWTITPYASVDAIMRVGFTYEYRGTSLTSVAFFRVNVAGSVGVCSESAAQSVFRASSGSHRGEDAAAMSMPDGWSAAVFFDDRDQSVDPVRVTSVAVVDESGNAIGGYEARLTGNRQTAGDNTLVCLSVLRSGVTSVVPTWLSVTLADSITEAEYTFLVPVRAADGHMVTFDGNGATSGSMDACLADGSFELPECGFAYDDRVFDHWEVNGQSYAPGDVIAVSDDVTVVAVWREDACVVSFDPNGGTGDMPSATVARNESWLAPDCGFDWWQHRFVSWNTKADGSGDTYQVGDQVDLSGAGSSLTLHAQWVEKGRITLMNGSTTVWSDIADGSTLSEYVAPTVDGFTLVGWYADHDIASGLCIDANGVGVAQVIDDAGVFDVDGDVTLHALWQGPAFVAVDSLYVPEGETREFAIVESFDVGQNRFLSRSSAGAAASMSMDVPESYAYGSDLTELGLCVTQLPNSCVWVGEWRRTNTDVDFYSLTAKGITSGKRYLRGNASNIEITDTLMYGSSYSNKQMWSYGDYGESTLICENQVFEARTMKCVGWTGSKWAQATTTGSVSLLGCVEDAYVFDVE